MTDHAVVHITESGLVTFELQGHLILIKSMAIYA